MTQAGVYMDVFRISRVISDVFFKWACLIISLILSFISLFCKQLNGWISLTIKCKRSKNRAIGPKESVFWVLLDTKIRAFSVIYWAVLLMDIIFRL